MGDKKISALTELTTAADDDSLVILDKDADVTKRIEVSNLVGTNSLLLKTAGTLSSSPQAVQSVGAQVSALQISSVGVKAAGTLTATGTSTLASATLSGTMEIGGNGVTVDTILDTDTLSEDDPNALATQQSIKAYVDTQILTEDTLAELNDTDITAPASGDVIIYDGSDSWDNKQISGDASMDNTGAVVVDGLQSRSVASTAPSDGETLAWDSGTSTWTPSSAGTGSVTSVAISGSDGIEVDSGSPITSTGTIALGLSGVDATKIADGSVTDTEFQYIGGLISDAQTQIDAKGAGTVTSVTAGAGMTQSGTSTINPTLDVVGTDDRITANTNDIDIASTYVGQTSITTLGTVATGTWSGTALVAGKVPNLNAITVPDGDVSLNSNKITSLADPAADADAATKSYVDAIASGLDVKESCRAASTANLTLSGTQTVDGVALVATDRVLVKDQSTGADNGIYLVNASTWTRATDFAAGSSEAGAFTFIEDGTASADNGFVCTNNKGSDVVGTDALAFSQFSGAGQITAGSGLTKSGNTLNVGAGTGITVNTDDVALTNSSLTVGTTSISLGGTETTIAGLTLTTPVLGTPTSGTLTNCTFPTLNQDTTGNAATATTAAAGDSATDFFSDGTIAAARIATLNQDTTGTSANVTGTVVVANGGTGVATIAANSLVTGNGTGAVTAEANLIFDATGLAVGTTAANAKLTVEGTAKLKEQSAAAADTAAYGQVWVKDAAPNELWFTDDDGNDKLIDTAELGIACSDEATAISSTGDKATFLVPRAMRLKTVKCNFTTKDSSTDYDLDIKYNASDPTSASSILATGTPNITISSGTYVGSTTEFEDGGGGSQDYYDLAEDSFIVINIATAGTEAKGLKCWLLGWWK